MSNRKWVRIIAGKGVGDYGYIERERYPRKNLTLIKVLTAFPFDMVAKQADMFERLDDKQCTQMEWRDECPHIA